MKSHVYSYFKSKMHVGFCIINEQSLNSFEKKYNKNLEINLSIDLLNRSFKINKMLKNYIK
jgi:hypothetical protein